MGVDLKCYPPDEPPDSLLDVAAPLTDETAVHKAVDIGCWPQPGRSAEIQATGYSVESLSWAEYKPRLGETAQSFPDDDIILIVTLTGMPNADALIVTLNQRTGSAFSTKTLGFKQQYLHDEVPYAQLSRLIPCGPSRNDDYLGMCWCANVEIIVSDDTGEYRMGPNHGPVGPLVSSVSVEGVERYHKYFGGTALWAAVSQYNGQRLPLELAQHLRVQPRAQPIDAGDVHATFADPTQASLDATPMPALTPTPAPRKPTYVAPSESDTRAYYDRWRGLKFRYTDDIFVRYFFPGYPLGQALTVTLVTIEHAPSGASAGILLLDDLIEVSPGVRALPHDPREPSSWLISRNATDAGKAALETALADQALLAQITATLPLWWLGPWRDQQHMDSQHLVVMWAEPAGTSGMSFKLKALILGGPNDSPELWCQGLDWGHGNGVHSVVTGQCLPYQEGSRIPRDFEQIVTYDSPGTYQATFELGPLSATTTIVVPWTP